MNFYFYYDCYEFLPFLEFHYFLLFPLLTQLLINLFILLMLCFNPSIFILYLKLKMRSFYTIFFHNPIFILLLLKYLVAILWMIHNRIPTFLNQVILVILILFHHKQWIYFCFCQTIFNY